MKKNIILIAYPLGEEPLALSLMEDLNSLGSVALHPYTRLNLRRAQEDYDVAVCVVVDEASIAEAHNLQQRLESVATIVVDRGTGQSIPVNGFSGLVSPASQEIVDAVAEILKSKEALEHETSSTKTRTPRPLASRFDRILSSFGGISHGFETLLAVGARHLSWELHAERAEAYFIDTNARVHCAFTTPSLPIDPAPMPPKALHVLQKRGRLTYEGDLTDRADSPLLMYLKKSRMNVVAPLMADGGIVGWLALYLEESLLTDSFLDDLHIATHLLSMSLSSASAVQPSENVWSEVLSSFDTALIVISSEGTIVDSTGQTLLIGGSPKFGQSFKTIRRGRVREVIAEALAGELVTATWYDPSFGESVECSASRLESGEIAIKLFVLKKELVKSTPQIELASFFQTLPVAVLAETVSGSSSSLPVGRISLEDSEAILRCTLAAKSKNVKSVKLRYLAEGQKGRAVMFFESSASESESHLFHDISDAVEFVVTPP